MKIGEAAEILKMMYTDGAASKEQAVQVHLFGVKFADQIKGMPLKELAIRADIPETYATEIRKGINLSKYVTVRA